MRKGRSSQTAQLVAFLRAMAHEGWSTVPGFSDPTAEAFLSPGWARQLARLRRRPEMGRALGKEGGTLLALRTVEIDRAVRESQARQLVILGAGFDGRAHRLPELAGARVFEVDHPDTQADKRERARALKPVGELTYVPVDFERDSLDAALERAGHARSEATCWVWEGVVMYLSDEAFFATLRVLEQRSAPGSSLVIHYNVPSRAWITSLFTRFWGEPQVGLRSPEVMASALARHGFRVESDSGAEGWAARAGSPVPRLPEARRGRILVAKRTPA